MSKKTLIIFSVPGNTKFKSGNSEVRATHDKNLIF